MSQIRNKWFAIYLPVILSTPLSHLPPEKMLVLWWLLVFVFRVSSIFSSSCSLKSHLSPSFPPRSAPSPLIVAPRRLSTATACVTGQGVRRPAEISTTSSSRFTLALCSSIKDVYCGDLGKMQLFVKMRFRCARFDWFYMERYSNCCSFNRITIYNAASLLEDFFIFCLNNLGITVYFRNNWFFFRSLRSKEKTRDVHTGAKSIVTPLHHKNSYKECNLLSLMHTVLTSVRGH